MQLTNESPGQPPVPLVLDEDEAGTEAAALTQADKPAKNSQWEKGLVINSQWESGTGQKQLKRTKNRSEETNEN
jgi:hypothetical protein